ncbi:MAG: hypothetical protein NWF03_08875 [Candidatus Bathyarchaeota archaeon]|nr:hypothetical protein [Candidatus Bathyarchaeota archaeon]
MGRVIMPTEAILKLLENGKWYYIKDIGKLTQLNDRKVETVTKFLEKYDFVKVDKTHQKIRLDAPTSKFFQKIREIELEEHSTKL